MANHDNGELSTDFDDENDSTLCMAHKDFSAGQQYTIFYGVRANIDLLVHNGFVFESNHDDCLTLKFGISKNDALAGQKLSILEELAIPRTGLFFMGKLPDKPLDPALMGFLRVLCLTSKDIDHYSGSPEQIRTLIEVKMNDENVSELDKKVYQYLSTRCQLLLKSYPTTLEQDLELLETNKNEEFGQKNYFSCLLRSKEKEMLNGAIKYCNDLIKA